MASRQARDTEPRRKTMKNTSASVVYDGDGNRVRKTVSGVTTHYLVSTVNPSGYAQVVEELTVSGGATNLSRVYAYGLDLISQRDSSSNVTYYGYDGNGNTRYLTTTNGTITDTYVYDAFGIQIASSGSTPNAYLYSGEQYDPNMGFYYLRSRYMNATTGRFWTRDAFQGNNNDPRSLHKYLYCANNPVDNADPLGLDMTPEQLLGYDAEEAIQEEYLSTHPGQSSQIFFGKWTGNGTGSFLKPDIMNMANVPPTYLEIKPISPSGVAKGVAKMALNATFYGPLKYQPERFWQPRYPLLDTPDGMIFVVNIDGIVFYQDAALLEYELITLAAVKNARDLLPYLKFGARKLAYVAARAYRLATVSYATQNAELQQDVGIGTILATGGAF
jgi:RHS repeat-associated protein